MAILCPQIPIIEFNPMPLEEHAKLFLECAYAVMLCLIRDVTRNLVYPRSTDREGAIPGLPGEVTFADLLVHPFRRIGLHVAQSLGHGTLAREFDQQMYVVRHSTDRDG